MAQKRKLSDLVREETQRPEPTESKELVTDLQTSEVVELQSTKVTDLQTPEVTDSETAEVPKYLTLVRKEVRLREDQLEQLTNLTRSLNRQRRGSGERITENTIIRVAVDLLLSQSKALSGNTEDEIKASVGLN